MPRTHDAKCLCVRCQWERQNRAGNSAVTRLDQIYPTTASLLRPIKYVVPKGTANVMYGSRRVCVAVSHEMANWIAKALNRERGNVC